MTQEFEVGDIVEVIKAADAESVSFEFMSGILDNIWTRGGVECFTVLFDGDHFAYATEIKFIRKGSR